MEQAMVGENLFHELIEAIRAAARLPRVIGTDDRTKLKITYVCDSVDAYLHLCSRIEDGMRVMNFNTTGEAKSFGRQARAGHTTTLMLCGAEITITCDTLKQRVTNEPLGWRNPGEHDGPVKA